MFERTNLKQLTELFKNGQVIFQCVILHYFCDHAFVRFPGQWYQNNTMGSH
jgi:hypothetical protein